MDNDHHHEHSHHADSESTGEKIKLAASATFHCLLGCGVGEVVGVVIGRALHFSNVNTIILAVSLGAVFGLALGLIPLIRAKFRMKDAFRQVLIAEGLSILVMETTEVLVEVYTPGFIAAFPVNYVLVGRGIRHVH